MRNHDVSRETIDRHLLPRQTIRMLSFPFINRSLAKIIHSLYMVRKGAWRINRDNDLQLYSERALRLSELREMRS